MDLSIIMLSYNTKELTLQALGSVLKSLQQSGFSYELLVLDNGSEDGSAQAIKAKFGQQIRLFPQKQNLGFGRGNNYLVKKTKGKYLLFLNSDIKALDDALIKLFHFFKSDQNSYAFVGSKLLNPDLTSQPSCAPFYTLPIVFGALFLKGDYWGLTRSSPNKTISTDWVSGACLMCRKADFLKLKGFDENIFLYMEEVDLLYRAKQQNYPTGFYPKAKLIHYGSASSQDKKEPILNVYRGLMYFYQKHYSRLANLTLRFLLKTKAAVGYTLGIISNNQYLKTTYGQAWQMV